MATYLVGTNVKPNATNSQEWQALHGPGSEVPHSGIYACTECLKEVACNAGDKFPPQNHDQHGPNSKTVSWKLLVKTQS